MQPVRGTHRREQQYDHAGGEDRRRGSTPRSQIQRVGTFLRPRGRAAGKSGHESRSGCSFEAFGLREFSHQTKVAEFTKCHLPMILGSEALDSIGPFLGRNMRPASSQTFRVDAAQRSFLERLPDGSLQVR
jgi:hypothetical protein